MDDDSPGVPEWIVTYGDMMSLLLTFFIMLVSLSEIEANQKYRAVLEALQQYIGYRTTPKSPPGKSFPLNSMVERLTKLGSHHKKREGFGGSRHEGPPGRDLMVFQSTQGTALRVGEPIPFPRTDTELTGEAVAALTQIVDALAGKPNKIEIVGHASPKPLPPNASERDKLLLSYLRARSTMRFLVSHGVDVDRTRIRAAGDTEPLSESGDKRSRQHDRVEVRIIDKFADHFVGPRDASQ
ncbi:MAG: flagellar motor protein MotB [Planctomycetaceae bacterium]